MEPSLGPFERKAISGRGWPCDSMRAGNRVGRKARDNLHIREQT